MSIFLVATRKTNDRLDAALAREFSEDVLRIAGNQWLVQAVMQLTEATGGLKKTVETLSEQVAQQQRTIRWMARILWMAGGVLLVLAPIAGWLINHRFDEILNALAKGGG